MEFAISILLSGISVGGQYALIAIGYTMVYGILRLINFAHGDVFMVAGLLLVYTVTWLPLPAAMLLVLAATVALIGAAVNAVTTIVYAVTLQFLEGSFTTVGYYSDPTMPTAPLVDVTAVGNVFTGELAPLMWIGVILVGAVVPLIAALLEKRSGATPAADGTAVASRAELWMAVAVIAAVIGAICMRVVFYELGASVFMLY